MVLDTTDPTLSTISVNTESPFGQNTPEITFSGADNNQVDYYEIEYTQNNNTNGVSLDTTIISPAQSPVNLDLDPDEDTHSVTITVFDSAGNSTSETIVFSPLIQFDLPSLSNTQSQTGTVTISSPSGNDLDEITLDAGTTQAVLNGCTGSGGDMVAPYTPPVECSISNINTSGTILLQARDSVLHATQNASHEIIIDDTDPEITITSPTQNHTADISDTTIQVTDNYGLSADDITLSSTNEAQTTQFVCSQDSATSATCTITLVAPLDSGFTLGIQAIDSAGNVSSATSGQYLISTAEQNTSSGGSIISTPVSNDNPTSTSIPDVFDTNLDTVLEQEITRFDNIPETLSLDVATNTAQDQVLTSPAETTANNTDPLFDVFVTAAEPDSEKQSSRNNMIIILSGLLFGILTFSIRKLVFK